MNIIINYLFLLKNIMYICQKNLIMSKQNKSISLSKEALQKAKSQQKKKMCASFSHYVEQLILNDK